MKKDDNIPLNHTEVQSKKNEKYPLELIWFAAIVFLFLPVIGLVSGSPFLVYEVFGNAAAAFIPFAICYYITWLIFRRIFNNKSVNKLISIIIISIFATLITIVAFYPEIYSQ